MDTFIFPLLMGAQQTSGAEGAAGGSLLATFIPFILIILIFYLLIIRPQSKKRKETEKMLGALRKGDRVVTIEGLYGTIQSVKEATVILRVADNVKFEVLRSAISSTVDAKDEVREESKPSIQEDQKPAWQQNEERDRQAREEKENYKRNVSSGAISFEGEINKITNVMEEYKQGQVKWLEMYQKYMDSLNADAPDNETGRWVYDYELKSFNDCRNKLVLLLEIRDNPVLRRLINDCDELENTNYSNLSVQAKFKEEFEPHYHNG